MFDIFHGDGRIYARIYVELSFLECTGYGAGDGRDALRRSRRSTHTHTGKDPQPIPRSICGKRGPWQTNDYYFSHCARLSAQANSICLFYSHSGGFYTLQNPIMHEMSARPTAKDGCRKKTKSEGSRHTVDRHRNNSFIANNRIFCIDDQSHIWIS